MLGEKFYNQVGKSRNTFLLFVALNLLILSGISFPFVIPGLRGFSLFFVVLTLLMYIIVANILVGLFKDRIGFVFTICVILISLGMGWRLWLEWGEVTLVEHTSLAVYIGYPSISAIILTIFYISSHSIARKLSTFH